MLPNPESDFLRDIDLLEERGEGNPISREFSVTIANLRKIWVKASRASCDTLGKIQVGCAHTMLRQTEIICIDKEDKDDDDDKQIWCWVIVTMPPERASGRSLSIECQTSPKWGDSLANLTNTNFNRSWEKSKAIIELDDKKDGGFSELFCVCSPIQSMHKTAHYIVFGVFPSVFTCPSSELFHNYVYEMLTAMPCVLYEDPYLDPMESKLARKHRMDRKPDFANAQDNAE